MDISETGRRIRAAMTYAGFKGRKALGEAVEISPSTLQRIEGLAEPARAPKRSELLAIAEACKVPMWFLEGGWDGWRSTGAEADIDAEAQAAEADLARLAKERRRSA